MVGRIGAQLALLTFGACILIGVAVGNSAVTILGRALLAMLVVLFVGQLCGAACKQVLREHLRARKIAIDQEHVAALRPAGDPATAAPQPAAKTG